MYNDRASAYSLACALSSVVTLQGVTNGADINRAGGEYGTALAAAVFGGEIDMMEHLLSRGASCHERKTD